jgi:hypothetical protein
MDDIWWRITTAPEPSASAVKAQKQAEGWPGGWATPGFSGADIWASRPYQLDARLRPRWAIGGKDGE